VDEVTTINCLEPYRNVQFKNQITKVHNVIFLPPEKEKRSKKVEGKFAPYLHFTHFDHSHFMVNQFVPLP